MHSDPNYPEDIRSYDNDPRSPFYQGPVTQSDFDEIKQGKIDGLLKKNKKDVADLMAEALTEQPQEWWDAFIEQFKAGYTGVIGARVKMAIEDYFEEIADMEADS